MRLVQKCVVAGLTVFIKEKQIAQNVPLAAFRAEKKPKEHKKQTIIYVKSSTTIQCEHSMKIESDPNGAEYHPHLISIDGQIAIEKNK